MTHPLAETVAVVDHERFDRLTRRTDRS